MSEFDGLGKHKKTQHALVGLGSAALAAAVTLPRLGGPNFPKGTVKCEKKKEKRGEEEEKEEEQEQKQEQEQEQED